MPEMCEASAKSMPAVTAACPSRLNQPAQQSRPHIPACSLMHEALIPLTTQQHMCGFSTMSLTGIPWASEGVCSQHY